MPEFQRSKDGNYADTLFERATAMHRQGHLLDAKAAYEKILRLNPRHVGAQHFLGVIAFQMGSPAEAVKLIRKAIKLHPSVLAACANHGLCLIVRRKMGVRGPLLLKWKMR